MGFKPDWPIVEPSKLGDDFRSWREGLAYPLQKLMLRVRDMTNGGLTLTDNTKAAIVTFSRQNDIPNPLVHGVEMPFKCPSFRPLGFTPLSSLDDGGAQGLPIANWKINYRRADAKEGWYGLTVQFSPPLGEASLHKSANQSIANGGSGTEITFDLQDFCTGSLAHSNTTNPERLTCNAAGLVEVFYEVEWTANATGSRLTWIGKNFPVAERRGTIRVPVNSGGDVTQVSTGGIWSVTAGDYLGIIAFQSSGGALNVIGAGTSSGNSCRAQARYVAPPNDYSANVTGILWGG